MIPYLKTLKYYIRNPGPPGESQLLHPEEWKFKSRLATYIGGYTTSLAFLGAGVANNSSDMEVLGACGILFGSLGILAVEGERINNKNLMKNWSRRRTAYADENDQTPDIL